VSVGIGAATRRSCRFPRCTAAGWGEKTGTFTNVNRTVHLSDKAVEPPGEVRSDLDIFLDYARRMEFTTLEGGPLLAWAGPEDAFEAWKDCSRGRPCDYTGINYDSLRGGSGIPWPCNEEYPDGRARLYENGIFPTDPDYRESYGHDLLTGATVGAEPFRALAPGGRAILKTAQYHPPMRSPTAPTRSGTRRAGRPITSIPGPRRAGLARYRRPRRRHGWSSHRRTRTDLASPKATLSE
jgi:anaerobic selenocysteine-containing dehydrogenase